ncbi:signal peptidase I [Paenibacillus tepidiphilus]|uniref:signal peptidase I n=1 Tax=Paenibacillus tepidiphilus TaxID=2608683 RepID=UPI00123B0C82|nr:signal peptidase I [Paenibacillus tepidiphilus]
MNSGYEGDFMRSRKQRYRSRTHGGTRRGRRRSWLVELRDFGITAVLVFALMSLLNIYVFNISTVVGQSMQPTLLEGEKLLISKISLQFTGPHRGDVVVLHDPSTGLDRKEYLVKRVVGIPGDIVAVKDHKLYVNGTLVPEPYIDTEIEDADFAEVTVSAGEYFVMGDNRHAGASKDSRYFGSVPKVSIVGKALFIWWPFSKLHGL